MEIVDLPQLLANLEFGTEIILASDGGAKHNNGSFGSIIASSSKVLVCLGGAAQGFKL